MPTASTILPRAAEGAASLRLSAGCGSFKVLRIIFKESQKGIWHSLPEIMGSSSEVKVIGQRPAKAVARDIGFRGFGNKAVPSWKSHWSWLGSATVHPISAMWAHSVVELPEGASLLRISASHGYRLWWDGVLFGQGPDRADPRYLYSDSYEFYSVPGPHVIAALVYHFNPEYGWDRRNWCLNNGPPGLIAEVLANGKKTIIPVKWKMRRSRAWDEEPIFSCRFRGPIQNVDVHVLNEELNEVLEGGGEWSEAETFRRQDDGLFPEPLENETPRLKVVSRKPVKITRMMSNRDVIGNHRSLFGHSPSQPLVVQPREGGTFIEFEFDTLFCGFPSFAVEGKGVVDVYYGEGGTLVRQERLRLSGAGRVTYVGMDWRGGTRIAFDCTNITAPFRLHGIEVLDQVYPFEPRGSFKSDSALWTGLWNISRATAWAGVRDHPFDCAREQALWLEDMVIHSKAVRACFGDLRPFRKGFMQALRPMTDEGIVPVPGPSGMGYYLSGDFLHWSLHALALAPLLHELLMWKPDPLFAEAGLDGLRQVFKFYEEYENEDGLICLTPEGKRQLKVFAGWNPTLREGFSCAANASYLVALQNAALVAGMFGKKSLQADWEARASGLAETMAREFWMPGRSLFSDGRTGHFVQESVSPTANAWCALAGLVPGHAKAAWADAVVNDARIMPPCTPYDASLLAMAFMRHNQDDALRNLLDGYFGSMVRYGNQFIPEFWREHSRTSAGLGDDSSQCHPFGTSPSFIFHEHVLGVKPLTPGWKIIQIVPHAMGLWSAGGSIPSPLGNIGIAWERTDCSWEIQVEIPEGMQAHLRLPRLGIESQELMIDEKVVARIPFWREYERFANRDAEARRDMTIHCSLGQGRHHVRTCTDQAVNGAPQASSNGMI